MSNQDRHQNSDYDPQTPEERLKEWGKSLHFDPWNYWPSMSVLGRIREEGAGASHSTAEKSDGGLGRMVDRMAKSIAKDRRCAEMAEAVALLPPRLAVIVDATYRSCASARDVPRDEGPAITMSGLTPGGYYTRRRELFAWLSRALCLRGDGRRRQSA